MEDRWRQRVEAIEKDHTSGAAEITRKVAVLMSEFLSAADAEWEAFFALVRAVVRGQPEMASVFNLVNGLLWSVGGAAGFDDRRRDASTLALREASKDVTPAIADRLIPMVKERNRLVTISNSSTLRGALLLLSERGVRFQVTCAEGRPMFEGRNLAECLARAGVGVRLVSDAAICGQLTESSVVVVGADAVRPQTFTNKVGTWPLALAARERELPFYVIAEKSKFLPETVSRKPRYESPRELWPHAPHGVEMVNCYFEETPLNLVRGIVTETGILAPGKAAETAASVEVYPGLWSTEH